MKNHEDFSYAHANNSQECSVDPGGVFESSATIPVGRGPESHASGPTSHLAVLQTALRNPVTVTGLLNQLNDLLASLPLGGVEEEEPPEYTSEAGN